MQSSADAHNDGQPVPVAADAIGASNPVAAIRTAAPSEAVRVVMAPSSQQGQMP